MGLGSVTGVEIFQCVTTHCQAVATWIFAGYIAGAHCTANNEDVDTMLAGAKVIVVDDDPGIRDLVADFLGRHGYEVITAASAQDLDGLLEQQAIDLIILDVMMPGLDGPATLKRIREHKEFDDIPVIFLTAKVQSDEVRELKNLGAIDVIPKPFAPLTIADMLKKIYADWAAAAS